MKKFKYFLITCGVLFLMLQCAPKTINPEPRQRQWMLIAFQDFGKDLLTQNKASIDLTEAQTQKHQYGAYMGCNRIFFTGQFSAGGAVKFSGVGSTMMFCDKNMELESAFGKALSTITKYKIDGHFLTLLNDSGQVMKFVAADWD